eukprot:9808586-Alexandrium_andersonii.AAC.1
MANSRALIRNAPVRNPCNPWLLARESRDLSTLQPPCVGRKQLQIPPRNASSGGFGVTLRAEPDGDDETGRWARRR